MGLGDVHGVAEVGQCVPVIYKKKNNYSGFLACRGQRSVGETAAVTVSSWLIAGEHFALHKAQQPHHRLLATCTTSNSAVDDVDDVLPL